MAVQNMQRVPTKCHHKKLPPNNCLTSTIHQQQDSSLLLIITAATIIVYIHPPMTMVNCHIITRMQNASSSQPKIKPPLQLFFPHYFFIIVLTTLRRNKSDLRPRPCSHQACHQRDKCKGLIPSVKAFSVSNHLSTIPSCFLPPPNPAQNKPVGDDAAQINVSHANYDEITVTTAMKLGTTTVHKTPTVSNIRK